VTDELPHNVVAERTLLAAILIDNSAYDRTANLVTEKDFRSDLHRRVYSAIVAMEGQGVDLITLVEKMREIGSHKDGDAVAIAALIDEVPNIAQIERYAEMVRDAALRRRVIVECHRLQKAAHDNAPITEIAAEGSQLFTECAEARPEGPQTIRRMVRRAMDDLEARMLSKSWITGVATGIRDLDEYTLGFQRGVLSLIGARPRVGKTALALSIALNIAAAGQRVLFFEFDMSPQMIDRRILSAESRVSAYKLKTGQGISDGEQKRIIAAAARLSALDNRLVVDHRARNIGALAAAVRRQAKGSNLDLVFVDHIGHVQGGKGEKRYLQLGDVSARMIELADATGVAMVCLVQLGRDAEDREPLLADLRESGNLEQDARAVVLLDRPFLRGAPGFNECEMVTHIAKNEGETGHKPRVHFALAIQRVTDQAETVCKYCSFVPRESEVFV
jgi:replicative DNA helicase